ncbi:hypothetical protein PInf_030162 [Phytophthora infestans]|nr:hypothetical protein PInf_030162 [Phytophthora infestans]
MTLGTERNERVQRRTASQERAMSAVRETSMEKRQPGAPTSVDHGQSTAPSSGNSLPAQERRSQQPAKPTPTTAAPRTQSEGRMNENSGRGSLDGVPSDVAGLEISGVESRTTFSMWLCEQHNVVNRKLNKPRMYLEAHDLEFPLVYVSDLLKSYEQESYELQSYELQSFEQELYELRSFEQESYELEWSGLNSAA